MPFSPRTNIMCKHLPTSLKARFTFMRYTNFYIRGINHISFFSCTLAEHKSKSIWFGLAGSWHSF